MEGKTGSSARAPAGFRRWREIVHVAGSGFRMAMSIQGQGSVGVARAAGGAGTPGRSNPVNQGAMCKRG